MHPARSLLLLPILAITAFVTACGGVANPVGWAEPLFTDSSVYYFPDSDELAGATIGDGTSLTPQWRFPGPETGAEDSLKLDAVYGNLLANGPNLYFAGWEGDVYAVEAATGHLVWTTHKRIPVDGSIVAGLATDGQRLIAATTEGRVYAFHLATGELDPGWPAKGLKLPAGVWATPIIRKDTVYLATMNGQVHAVRAADSTPVWSAPFKSSTGAIPELALPADDTLFVPTLGRKIYFLNPDTGEERAPALSTDAWVWSTPAVRDGLAYFGDFAGTIHAVDITSAQERWNAEVGAKVKAAPAFVGDTLIVADRGPAVNFFAPTGERRGNRVSLPGGGTVRANVVAHNGAAYILTTAGKLFRADPVKLTVVEVPVSGAAP